MGVTVHMSYAGWSQVLKSGEMQAIIAAKAEQIASSVEAEGITVGDREGGPHEIPLPVEVSHGVTDRARSRVTLAHPSGIAVQAKHGVLTRAAAAAGLEVNS